MRHFSILLVLSSTLSCLWAQPYACSLDTKIGCGDLGASMAPKALADGYDPAISPDGKRIAFTQYDEAGNRRIAIMDIATRKSQLVEGIPGDNNYGPVWSPDGKDIYFNHFLDSDWTVARVNSEGGGFQIVYPGSVAFAVFPDGKSLLCNDMSKFFVLALDQGKAGTRTDLPVDAKYESTSIPCRIDISPDGKSALFEMSVESDIQASKTDYPPVSIWREDLSDGSLTRVTPPGINAIYPSWLPDGSGLLFAQDGPGKNMTSMYRKSLSLEAKPELVAKKATQPTVARQ